MSVLKCKMCGGELLLTDGENVAECDYCGSLQTVPTIDEDKKQKLYDRANKLRFHCDFDKAYTVFEKIVNEFPDDAEGYWGLLLCKYGIEYIDDPLTGKKIPTCHRSSFDSIMDDPDFDMVMENAEPEARNLYRIEAKQIEELRKSIIEVSEQEQPYDIFICYKETDDIGQRTIDSVIAQDVFEALSGKGYRVFFSRISLEDKLGTEYEPYIFAALNSAKIMLAFGTSYDNYNAVWVKNEWSRFLKLMAADKEKYLIPCFKNIDAYDIPKEFSKFQAQDMGKVGAIQDLLRGIDKIFGRGDSSTKPSSQETIDTGLSALNAQTKALVKRGYMALEDGEFKRASDFFEQALNNDAECGQAYLGQLMADLHVHHKEDLGKQKESFAKNKYYIKAIRFSDENLKAELQEYLNTIKFEKLEERYKEAVHKMETARYEADYSDAIKIFLSIPDHKDSSELASKCAKLKDDFHTKAQILRAKNILDCALSEDDLLKAIKEIGDSQSIPEIADLIEKARKNREENVSIAQDLWKDYLSKRQIIDEIEAERELIRKKNDDSQKRLSSLIEELDKIRIIKGHIQHNEAVLQSEEKALHELEVQLQQAKKELDKLGLFALGAKKEANARISNLQTLVDQQKGKIESVQKDLDTLKKDKERLCSEDDYEEKISLANEDLDHCEQDYSNVNARHKEAELSLAETRNEIIMTPQYLSVLVSAKDLNILTRLLSDEVIVLSIQTNPEMNSIMQQNILFGALPSEIKSQFKRTKGKNNDLDIEALYFQACQAMENPSSNEDIIWAKDQFMKIPGYKDSDIRVSECNRMIAGA